MPTSLTPFSNRSYKAKNGLICVIDTYHEADLSEVLHVECAASSYPWSEKNFKDSISSSHICIAVRFVDSVSGAKTPIVAQAVFSIACDEAELLILSVDPKYQKMGVASGLLNTMEDYLSQYANEIFLEVRASNSNAIALYERLNFNCLGERKNYYPAEKGARETALIYGKNISGQLCL